MSIRDRRKKSPISRPYCSKKRVEPTNPQKYIDFDENFATSLFLTSSVKIIWYAYSSIL